MTSLKNEEFHSNKYEKQEKNVPLSSQEIFSFEERYSGDFCRFFPMKLDPMNKSPMFNKNLFSIEFFFSLNFFCAKTSDTRISLACVPPSELSFGWDGGGWAC